MLLVEYGLEKIHIAGDKAGMDNLHIRERLETTRGIIEAIKDNVVTQARAVETVKSMRNGLFQMVSGELKSSLTSLAEMVAAVCVSTQQIYDVVLQIRESLATVGTRWTYFQAPLVVEDALGFKFSVPSEYDFDLLDTMIQHRFRLGDGSLHVQAGKYQLSKAKNSRDITSPGVRLSPGMEMKIAIIIASSKISDERCPMRY